ncbi:MAG: tetratricopeptide repeat protein, partial [Planctomycetota bacterium]
PKRLRDLRGDVPAALEQTVQKMIQKDPSSRPDSMKAVIADLESLSPRCSLSKEQVVSKRTRRTTIGVLAAIVACVGILALLYLRPWAIQEKGLSSIAVLPFVNMSADPNQEYFCDGMAEELINALSQIEDLRVIARTSAFSFKAKDVTVRDIGSQLNVATILEGSVRKADNRLRITAQLVDTTGGHHLWSESYDRDMGDVFVIQAEITSAIVDKLKPKLLGQKRAKLAERQPVNLEAYDLYLRGRFFGREQTEVGAKKAIECFEQAVEKDPNYAPAYAELALSYGVLPAYSPLPSKEVVPKARKMALKALEIDETLAEAHAALALIKEYDWDWEGSEREYKRAFELNPGYAEGHRDYSFHLLFRARFDEALKEMEQALKLDPLSVVLNQQLAVVCRYAKQFDRAIEACKRVLEMDPSRMYAHLELGQAYLGKAMYEEALIEFQKEKEISKGVHAWAELYTGFTYAEMGKPDEAQKVLDDLLEHSKQEYASPFILACLHFVLGRNDEGFNWVNKAYEERDLWLSYVKIDWTLDGVRSDPKYTALLKKMNLDE